MAELSEGEREALAEALNAVNASGWHVEAEHGCNGTEEVCMARCPIPVQVQDPPDYIADALASTVARIVAERVRGAEAKVARVEALLDEAESGAEAWGTCSGEWLRLDRLRAALSAAESPADGRGDDGAPGAGTGGGGARAAGEGQG